MSPVTKSNLALCTDGLAVGQEWTSADRVIEHNVGPTMRGKAQLYSYSKPLRQTPLFFSWQPEGEGGGQSKAVVRLFTPPKSKVAGSRMSFGWMLGRGARREYAVTAQSAAKISAQAWATSELVAMSAR